MIMRLPTESGVRVVRALHALKTKGPARAEVQWINFVEYLRDELVKLVQLQWALVSRQLGTLCECFSGNFESSTLALWLKDLLERREFDTVKEWYAESYKKYAAWMQQKAKDNNPAMRVARSWRLKQIPPRIGSGDNL